MCVSLPFACYQASDLSGGELSDADYININRCQTDGGSMWQVAIAGKEDKGKKDSDP